MKPIFPFHEYGERGKMIHSTVKQKQKLIRSSKQRKIDKLRKIIPGCEEVDIELEMQVDIFKTLSKLHGVWSKLLINPLTTSNIYFDLL